MAGLEDIFSAGTGAYDAVNAGENDYLNQQKTLADLTKSRIANEQARALNPLLLEQQRLSNSATEAQIPGIIGQSKSLMSKGLIDESGVPDQIKLKARENFSKMQDHELQDISRLGQVLGLLGAQTKGMPDAERAIVVGNTLMKFGMEPDTPQIHRLMSLKPEQLGYISEYMAQAEPKHQQQMQVVNTKEAGDTTRTSMNNQTQKEVASIYASNKLAAANNFWISYRGLKSSKDKHAALISEAERIKDTDPTQAQQYLDMAAAIRPQAEAEIASQKPGAMDTPAMTGMPATKGPQIAPPGNQSQRTQEYTMSDLKKLYPGRSDAELRDAYKRKFGKDIN